MLWSVNGIVVEPSSLGIAAKITAIGNFYIYIARNHKQRTRRRIDINSVQILYAFLPLSEAAGT